MSVRDIFLQLGFVIATLGASLAVWALLSGQLDRPKRAPRRGARKT